MMVDELYERSREQLLPYEDARFAALLSGVPDYYNAINDYPVWGAFLRALAYELGRIEYMYTSDVVTVDPQYATPPDLLRRYSGLLSIPGTYPYAGQDDQSVKAMVLNLLDAYEQGTTVSAIEGVISAYTGVSVPVEELWRKVGDGVYDISDVNTLRIAVNVDNITPLSEQAGVVEIQTLSRDIYGALDLTKPAHIGLDFALVFGSSEDASAIVSNMTDTMDIIYDVVEQAPLEPVLTAQPLFDPTSPVTQIAAYGKKASRYLAPSITADEYAALMSDDFRAEYIPQGTGYVFDSRRVNDVLLLDANGNLTGVVSRATGVVGPRLLDAWQVRGESVQIFEMD